MFFIRNSWRTFFICLSPNKLIMNSFKWKTYMNILVLKARRKYLCFGVIFGATSSFLLSLHIILKLGINQHYQVLNGSGKVSISLNIKSFTDYFFVTNFTLTICLEEKLQFRISNYALNLSKRGHSCSFFFQHYLVPVILGQCLFPVKKKSLGAWSFWGNQGETKYALLYRNYHVIRLICAYLNIWVYYCFKKIYTFFY
jgi:hypothetical protein